MRDLLELLCVCALGVLPIVGCSEAADDVGSVGSAGQGGGGAGGIGGGAVSGVGDPCVPDVVPAGGFAAGVTYLATGLAECETGVCLVRGLMGDPNNLQEDSCPLGNATCVSTSEVERSIYCSCRCDAGGAVPTCDCPSGFMCEDISETGDARRLGYCVREDAGM